MNFNRSRIENNFNQVGKQGFYSFRKNFQYFFGKLNFKIQVSKNKTVRTRNLENRQ